MVVGIDLGTTNSAIGIWRGGRAQLIPNSLGSVLTPSAVSVDDGGEFVIGLAARQRQITHPTLSATSFKRFMGSNRSILLGARHTLRPEELSAMVLRSLKADAEVFLGEPVVEAVITVPAYFNDKQRKATRRAGELAGFKVERLLNEPTLPPWRMAFMNSTMTPGFWCLIWGEERSMYQYSISSTASSRSAPARATIAWVATILTKFWLMIFLRSCAKLSAIYGKSQILCSRNEFASKRNVPDAYFP